MGRRVDDDNVAEVENEDVVEKQDVDIVVEALDEEWASQPGLYAKYSSMAADARRDWDDAKARLELVKAELDNDVRSNPEDYNLTKVTESTVAAAIPIQKAYQKANEAVIEARHHLEVCNGITTALEHKKAALQKLVDLFFCDYHSAPKASSRSKDKIEEVEKKTVRRRGRRSSDDDDS